MGERRGLKISIEDRKAAIYLIDEAINAGARQAKACKILGIDERTLQRWRLRGDDGDNRKGPLTAPSNKLTEQERQKIISVSNSPEFCNLSPRQIVPKLADKGVYIGSESSFYRVLHENDMIKHRNASKPREHKKPNEYVAKSPNEIWSWDITYLKTHIKGHYFYLYLIMDIFSRKIVGFDIHIEESSDFASIIMQKACDDEGVTPEHFLVLHSDNGSPMKGSSMLGTLQRLGVMPSFSRPSVSDDNAFAEAMFKTLKYSIGYPTGGFCSLEAAQVWVKRFVEWYNNIHLHSGIKFVSPAKRHSGDDIAILSERKKVYEEAKQRNPNRWSGETRNWRPISEVFLNPQKKRACEAA